MSGPSKRWNYQWFLTFLPPSNRGMHADCTGVIDANPIFAMAEAVGAESGGDNDDQEELDDMVFHLLHYTALTALNLACFTL